MGVLDGKVALVTGASRGIGKAIAIEMARAGAKVALNYRTGEAEARAIAGEIARLQQARADEEALAEASGGLESDKARRMVSPSTRTIDGAEWAKLIKADVSNPEQARDLVRQVTESWGRLDILVNNAGITRDRVLRKMSDEEWEIVIATNLNSAFYCTSAAVPVMVEKKYGRIVSISSVIGQSGNIGQANYAAAKAGMIAFTKSVAQEVARHNITVNTVCPGFTATEMLSKVPEDVQEKIKAKIPLGRFGEAEEIARAVLFLVADGDYITGQQINVNGGIYM